MPFLNDIRLNTCIYTDITLKNTLKHHNFRDVFVLGDNQDVIQGKLLMFSKMYENDYLWGTTDQCQKLITKTQYQSENMLVHTCHLGQI